MNIITYSASPYLCTKLGRINSYLLENLDTIGSICWHHDPRTFLPDEKGKYFYEKDNKNICELFPVTKTYNEQVNNQFVVDVYDKIEALSPDYVIAIGDYSDMDQICAVKEINDSFNLIGILTIDALPIKNNYIEIINKFDAIILTNKKSFYFLQNKFPQDKLIYYGSMPIDSEIFNNSGERDNLDKFSILGCLKNSQSCNTAAFIKAVGEFSMNKDDVESTLYTNYNDPGEYDIDELLKRYDKHNKINLPNRYISVLDGITDSELNDLYNRHHVIIDPSVSSATALHIFEAVSTGCVPIVIDNNIIKDYYYIAHIQQRYIIDSVLYIGNNEEHLFIASIESIKKNLKKLYYNWKVHSKAIKNLGLKYEDIIKYYNKNGLLTIIDIIINNEGKNKKIVDIDMFCDE